jgi:hypothetical protein
VNSQADRARNADATPVALPWSGDRTKISGSRPVTRSPGRRRRSRWGPSEELARRGDEGPVNGAVTGGLACPREHPQLMAEHCDLEVPLIQARPNEQAEHAA